MYQDMSWLSSLWDSEKSRTIGLNHTERMWYFLVRLCMRITTTRWNGIVILLFSDIDVIIIIIIIIINCYHLYEGIYNYIPETNHVTRLHSFVAIL
jgi:hypothetical protein